MKQFLASLALLAVLTSGASAAATPAQKESLTKTNRGCDGHVIGRLYLQPFGFVNLVKTGSDKLVANVVLQGGTPSTNFNVRLIQITGASDCGSCDSGGATLTTDSKGNGNVNVQQAVIPGVTSAWVDLNNKADCDDFFTTVPLSF
ncbi:hypothetical protein BO99DRAFT_412493 [Aspergillus violaceofuscus CBS 115571]|uniref:Secreted protein n=1 Tax=Aspergillus violaceofuscus (strain CBS 115571) TaxID=1450538 RepID=A0A2V5HB93_ASPV1|nr:hypothetical protein BO99DRAFT_412493 [Aspergillus violaceofuscus CBS 115571]